MGAELPNRLRQVPRDASRQQGDRRGAASRVFPKGPAPAGIGEGKTLAVAEPMGGSVGLQTPGVEPAFRAQPQGIQSLPPQREPRPAVDIWLRGRDAELPAKVD